MSDRQPAPKDGVQTVNGLRFRAVRGEMMLPGAVFTDPAQEAKDAADQAAAQAADQAAAQAAAEADAKAKADQAAAEAAAKAKGGKGPDDTTDGKGPEAKS